MTTTLSRPAPPPFIHSGYNDLVSLVASTPSKLGADLASNPRLSNRPQARGGYANTGFRFPDGLPRADSYVKLIAEQSQSTSNGRAAFPSAGAGPGRGGRGVPRGHARGGGRTGAAFGREEWRAVELKKRKVDKRMIGHPTDFRHIFHASTFEEATELLLRWSIEGLGDKLGDPGWAYPIKELVKARAREQQARAVAAVVEATARTRELRDIDEHEMKPPGTLRVVNGLPSSIYSTTNTLLKTTSKARPTITTQSHKQTQTQSSNASRSTGQTSISPLLTGGSTPIAIANFQGYFDHPSSSSSSAGVSASAAAPSAVVVGRRTPTSPLNNPFTSPNIDSIPESEGKTRPLQIKKKSNSALPIPIPIEGQPTTKSEEAIIEDSPISADDLKPSTPPTPSRRKDARPRAQEIFTQLPFRIIKPSLETLEKSMSIALFFEQYYHSLLKPPAIHINGYTPTTSSNEVTKPVHPGNYVLNRARRLANLESTFNLPENRYMSEDEKDARRDELVREENRILRERRKRVDVKGFELGRVIGHGAFGVVRIAREKESGRLVAMKQLRKADMLRKSQEGHVRAEKDLLAAAASKSLSTTVSGESNQPSWIVQLFYAFQDTDHLYLVLEFMGGGDLLNLLVERDTFPEEMTRFYVAEMVLALEETHSLGFIHRDIKPDNFLFTKSGHIRISDFGLATDLHWAHDTSYYEHQRLAILKKHGVDLEYPSVKTKRMKKPDIEKIMGKEWMGEGKGVLTWRDAKRRSLAYSVCGTNSYMAPEVIRGQGYGFSCDWWSLGIIMYESLYGYPPFVSSSRHITRQKILNWKTTLKFPPKPRLSPECLDLMTCLLCEPEDRLGTTPTEKASILTISTKGTLDHTLNGRHAGLGKGLGNDGPDKIKAHRWFANIDWDNLHKQTPPYHPDLYAEDDTRHFDDDIPDEPLAPANGAAANATKDPLLRDKTHGAHLLEIRKSLAFKGWTFKSPSLVESRYGHLQNLSHTKDVSEETVRGHENSTSRWDDVAAQSKMTSGTVRNRALSF
ncbi:uncharacterized protein I303_108089 [Kwoniella dejecticola CBS 10117]|uniref:non-specific serine/threonine protein kinase n=1 Tax=Kwoniella dejecticola CBS 10117 TaxID=1296121 RepID=A0A1A5ZWI5_9TREE|nr:AGC/NDR/NDR protein kinase [Kwoniella dejecticola CBS 10117]OBR82166.1 AGC/NDR/NDR protein kinase [Kwoniella dejecticola CBS 10117]